MLRNSIYAAVCLATFAAACSPRLLPIEENRSDNVSGATDSEAGMEREDAEDWRDVDPENILVIKLEWGNVLIELAPQFAPAHVGQIRRLVRAEHYETGATFYRVIDNFVAQGGVLREVESEADDAYDDGVEAVEAEFERPLEDLIFVQNESPDLYAPETGHIDGFAVGFDPVTGHVWPLHCYGVVAMARDSDPDTGSSHFYIVIGRDQRYLDRNLTVFGRVISGMDNIQRVIRGDRSVDNGVIPDPAKRTQILGMSIAADLPDHNRPQLQVMKSDSPAFAEEKDRKYYRDSDFFQLKPKAVEACAVTGPARTAPRGNSPDSD